MGRGESGTGVLVRFWRVCPAGRTGPAQDEKNAVLNHTNTISGRTNTVLNHTFRHYIRANKPRFKSRIQTLYQGKQTPF